MYLQQNKVGVGVAAETGFYTRGDRRTVRAADYAFIPNERIPVDGLPAGYSQIVPALVVEVVSPFDTAAYIEQKVGEWLDFGVRLVWVLYPDTRHVYIYRQEEASPRVLKAADTIEGGDVLPGFSLTVGKFFEG
jgi:Uma2 family endonuclease